MGYLLVSEANGRVINKGDTLHVLGGVPVTVVSWGNSLVRVEYANGQRAMKWAALVGVRIVPAESKAHPFINADGDGASGLCLLCGQKWDMPIHNEYKEML